MDGEILYPLYRDSLFVNAKRIADYEKTKQFYQSIIEKIDRTELNVKKASIPKNPRQDIMQRQDKNNLRILQRQKQRLEDRLKEMEKIIRENINSE